MGRAGAVECRSRPAFEGAAAQVGVLAVEEKASRSRQLAKDRRIISAAETYRAASRRREWPWVVRPTAAQPRRAEEQVQRAGKARRQLVVRQDW